MTKFSACDDCAFQGVEPAICSECHEADQFIESDETSGEGTPIYFRDWRDES